ncbi:signal recognition particle-docking protein FtsY [Psychrosphaera sp. B3R10]|uniref:signal recognition particle-docking protein FtsY n=1 Tax=unclassified Psychrosphaera TaxID=2641570 RepID=UPI001C0A4E32|nr:MULTISPECIES: signal recognition particle-docking protein FtsY [unclassified Psychrosphaera]MBU2882606.1 signal recognition particle-docking protein FtsY [Psychrosphaera sp. I2R16]MBU2989375.1 signal recognition particle-docking protein FtsY [Psychrosphaera sp. B3R10]
MAKKSGFLSWFKKGAQEPQKQPENTEQSQLVESDSTTEIGEKSNQEKDVVGSETTPSNNGALQEANVDADEAGSSIVEDIAPITPSSEEFAVAETGIDEPVATDNSEVASTEPGIPEEDQDTRTETSEVTDDATLVDDVDAEAAEATENDNESTPAEPKIGFFERLKRGLSKTRQQIGGGFLSLFKGKQIDDDLYEELETQLLMADVGMDTTVKLINRLTEHADRKQLKDADALYGLLKSEMSDILKKSDAPLVVDNDDGPFVILMVGVNGVGKTTTIGKMAKQFQQQGKSVMLAAGDTFRAAAVEQLQVWGDRNNVPVIAQHTGADSASVIFDAYQAAKARKADVLIADTAGRLQNKDNLMQELEKIVRVLKKLDANIPHEIMLTIDATTGQNAISQTKLFNQAVGLTGISLTKLDGTAKGGVIFAVAEQFEIPIRYIGVGEGIEDLRTFEHQSFIDALFDESEN